MFAVVGVAEVTPQGLEQDLHAGPCKKQRANGSDCQFEVVRQWFGVGGDDGLIHFVDDLYQGTDKKGGQDDGVTAQIGAERGWRGLVHCGRCAELYAV